MSRLHKSRETFIQKLGCKCSEFTNTINTSKVFTMENDDHDNLFAIIIKTPPINSRGTPHVLEHCVLGGSKKFPIKEPFSNMLKRCFSTYMNAMTFNDITVYVVSSQHKDSFYKLSEVMLDAVFYPLLREETFLQEGIRIQNEESSLVPHGVVFNEMKGALSSPRGYIWECLRCQMFPNSHYRFNYGGSPIDLIDLQSQEIIDFHKEYYSPQKAYFFFYGNIPSCQNINFLNRLLTWHEQTDTNIDYKNSYVNHHFKSINSFYPQSNKEDMPIFSIAWILGTCKDRFNVLLANLIIKMLTEHDCSLLSKVLLDSGFCQDVEGIIIDDMSQIILLIECNGVSYLHSKQAETFIIKTIKDICNRPIDIELIQACKNQVIMELLEIDGGSDGHIGVNILCKNIIPIAWGADFFESIYPSHQINKFMNLNEESIKNNIYERLTNKDKYSCSLFSPQEALSDIMDTAINLAIREKLHTRSPEKYLKQLQVEYKSLKAFQDIEDDISILPLSSLEHASMPTVYHITHKNDIQTHTCNTNGFVYICALFPIESKYANDLPMISLALHILDKSTVYNWTLSKFVNYKDTYLSYMECYITLINNPILGPQAYLTIDMGFLKENHTHALKILEMLTSSFDISNKQKNNNLICQHFLEQTSNITEEGLQYARIKAAAVISDYASLQDGIEGYEYYKYCNKLRTSPLPDFQSVLEDILSNKPILLVTCEKEDQEHVISQLENISLGTKHHDALAYTINQHNIKPSIGFIWGSPVAHNSMAINTNSNDLIWEIASSFLSNEYLLKHIREIGGAYHSSMKFIKQWNCVSMCSYRDPNVKSTISCFNDSFNAVTSTINKNTFDDAKRSIIQRQNCPECPQYKAIRTWKQTQEGKPPEILINNRKLLINISLDEFISEFETVYANIHKQTKSIVSFAPKALINEMQYSHVEKI